MRCGMSKGELVRQVGERSEPVTFLVPGLYGLLCSWTSLFAHAAVQVATCLATQ